MCRPVAAYSARQEADLDQASRNPYVPRLRPGSFQQQAVDYIDQNKSVLVAAPTGVGKTLIADYIIEKIYREGGRVVYTAPIKALSNQKFREFKGVVGKRLWAFSQGMW